MKVCQMRKLQNVWQRLVNVQEDLTASQRNELLIKFQRTKHLMIWGDDSTILNHAHILYLIQYLYDPAFFSTPEEMKLLC